jgi:hypothetical protein
MALSARGRGDVVRRKMLLEEDVSGGQEELWEENYLVGFATLAWLLSGPADSKHVTTSHLLRPGLFPSAARPQKPIQTAEDEGKSPPAGTSPTQAMIGRLHT